MSKTDSFNSTVAARTRAALHILGSAELLAAYESHGGLATDLRAIADAGKLAEERSQNRSGAQAAGGAATTNVAEAYAALQKDYGAVMAVVQAVKLDLERAKAPKELVAAVGRILVNEAQQVVVKPGKPGKKEGKSGKASDPADAGNSGKEARRLHSAAREAQRAEIEKDAVALLALKGALPALAKRKVDKKRLDRLRDDARSLSGAFAKRDVKKGAAKEATTAIRDAVADQKQLWAACRRLLAALARENPSVAALLREATG